MESEATTTYKNSLTKLPHGMKVVEECYSAIQKIIQELEDYLSVSLFLIGYCVFKKVFDFLYEVF